VDKRFLFHFLDWDKDLIKAEQGAGTTMIHVTKGSMEARRLRLPPLPEQRRIVALLDEAFAGLEAMRANAEKNLQNARNLFDSYLNAAFTQKGEGWKEMTLHDVSREFGRGKSKHRPRNDPKLYGGRYPFIQTGDVRNCDHIILSSTQTYNEIGLAQSKLWPKGTICITIAANIAETGILGFDACFPDSVIGMVVNENKTTNEFVEYLLQFMKTHLKAQGKGSAQDNINLGTFENRLFPFPDLPIQRSIVDNLNFLTEYTGSLETIYRQKLAAIDELRQSILQRTFSGQLTSAETIAA
jgi:type I restriction enzyme S subunit